MFHAVCWWITVTLGTQMIPLNQISEAALTYLALVLQSS